METALKYQLSYFSAALRGSMTLIIGGWERTAVEKIPPSSVTPKPLASPNNISSMVST